MFNGKTHYFTGPFLSSYGDIARVYIYSWKIQERGKTSSHEKSSSRELRQKNENIFSGIADLLPKMDADFKISSDFT